MYRKNSTLLEIYERLFFILESFEKYTKSKSNKHTIKYKNHNRMIKFVKSDNKKYNVYEKTPNSSKEVLFFSTQNISGNKTDLIKRKNLRTIVATITNVYSEEEEYTISEANPNIKEIKNFLLHMTHIINNDIINEEYFNKTVINKKHYITLRKNHLGIIVSHFVDGKEERPNYYLNNDLKTYKNIYLAPIFDMLYAYPTP